MNIIDEITDRLNDSEDDHQYDVTLMSVSDIKLLRHARDDIALLLEEVKRLEGMLTGEVMDNCRLRTELSEAEGLALSLAEALERGRDYLVALEENIIRNDVDMHIDACPPPSAVARDMSAALSSPALLKLKGSV